MLATDDSLTTPDDTFDFYDDTEIVSSPNEPSDNSQFDDYEDTEDIKTTYREGKTIELEGDDEILG